MSTCVIGGRLRRPGRGLIRQIQKTQGTPYGRLVSDPTTAPFKLIVDD